MSEAVKRLKPRMLQRVIDAFEMEQVLVFCRTNYDCDNIERFLNGLADGMGGSFRGKRESGKEHLYSCVVLAGARSTEERRRALEAFKEGDVRILVCTDVAARGIDVRGLPYVINMTLPDADQIEDYIHRVGRVGRADTMGLAISLVSAVPEKVWYCTKKGYKPWFSPSNENVKTHQEGGHTKWYDESALLKRIEKRLKQAVQPLHPDLSLPASIQGKAQYGQNAKDKFNEEAAERVAALKPTVTALNELEVQAQHSYLSLRTMWA
jgi:ATP-dependent RNA helicase DDX1